MTPRMRSVAACAAAVAAVGIVAGLFLSLYTSRHYVMPVGYDTPKYVWRANLVEAQGTDALAGSAQPPLHVNADRPGHPALMALLHGVTGVQPLDLTFVLPAVVAAVVGLGAGAFAVRVLREPWWAFAVYTIGVGASVNVALIAIGYADTLLAAAVLIAAATTAIVGAGGERGLAATVVLVAGGVTIHWNFTLLFLLVLVGVAVLLVPESLRARRAGASLWRTPSGRLGVTVAGSLAAGVAALLVGPGRPNAPSLGRPEFLDKIHRDVPRYTFAGVGPAAAVGAAALWTPPDPDRRRGLALAVVWALGGAAAVALLFLGAAVPAHRILAFSLGIPLLVTAAAVGIARIVSSTTRPLGPILGAAIVLGALAGIAALGHAVWTDAVLWVQPEQFAQAKTAGEYMQAVDGDRPVVFIVDVPAETQGAVNLPFRIIRSALPGDQITRSYVYLGDVDALLAGKPTLRKGEAGFNEVSRDFFDGLRPVLDEHPVVLTLRTFDRRFDELARRFVHLNDDVLIVRGPVPTSPMVKPAPRSPHSTAWLALMTAATLAVLLGVGIGWSLALVPGSIATRIALAPAFGIATLVLSGVVAGRLGFGLGGGAGIAIAVVTGVLGEAAHLVRAAREAPSGRPSPPASAAARTRT